MLKIEWSMITSALLIVVVALVLIGFRGAAAHATASPVGACCLANGQCLQANQFDCDGQSGDFIGPDTSCNMIDCPTMAVEAPVLSIFGMVAAVGALIGLGLYRQMTRRSA